MWLYIVGGLVLLAVLVLAFRGRGGGRDLMAPGAPIGARPIAGSTAGSTAGLGPSEERVIELARAGDKIGAIKMLRGLRSISLRDAKDYVDRVAAGQPAPVEREVPPVRQTGGPSDEEILDVARRGNKIEAIKMARQAYGWGLREAKDWVEAHE